jgi:glutathione-specific gamma-glutamylcyclotransferase
MTTKPESDLWVFGYGSLMWRPGFSYAERHKATLDGWHRSLCVYSHVYRGTPQQPGLVLGLDLGGHCHGVAFRIEGPLHVATVRYLREREQVTAVYVERAVRIVLETGEQVAALTYVADRRHPQYAGRLSRGSMLKLVRSGMGASGKNADYVTETNDHLIAIGVRDPDLEWLSAKLGEAEPTRRRGYGD